MTSLFIRRKGIWLFVFAIAWYLAGCFINKYLEVKSDAGKKDAQHFQQGFSAEAISELSIKAAAALKKMRAAVNQVLKLTRKPLLIICV